MELAPELVVGSQLREILFEAKRLEHSGINAEGHRGIAPLGTVERLTGDTCTLRHGLHRILPPPPCELEIGANLREQAPGDPAKQIRFGLQEAFSRKAQQDEIDHCLALIKKLKADHGLNEQKALERFCLLVLNLNEFIYLD